MKCTVISDFAWKEYPIILLRCVLCVQTHPLPHPFPQAIPLVTSKVRTVLGGWLYAFETPPPSEPQPVTRSESIEHIAR